MEGGPIGKKDRELEVRGKTERKRAMKSYPGRAKVGTIKWVWRFFPLPLLPLLLDSKRVVQRTSGGETVFAPSMGNIIIEKETVPYLRAKRGKIIWKSRRCFSFPGITLVSIGKTGKRPSRPISR